MVRSARLLETEHYWDDRAALRRRACQDVAGPCSGADSMSSQQPISVPTFGTRVQTRLDSVTPEDTKSMRLRQEHALELTPAEVSQAKQHRSFAGVELVSFEKTPNRSQSQSQSQSQEPRVVSRQ